MLDFTAQAFILNCIDFFFDSCINITLSGFIIDTQESLNLKLMTKG